MSRARECFQYFSPRQQPLKHLAILELSVHITPKNDDQLESGIHYPPKNGQIELFGTVTDNIGTFGILRGDPLTNIVIRDSSIKITENTQNNSISIVLPNVQALDDFHEHVDNNSLYLAIPLTDGKAFVTVDEYSVNVRLHTSSEGKFLKSLQKFPITQPVATDISPHFKNSNESCHIVLATKSNDDK